MIGVFDSGLGGLTVLAALRRADVDEEIVYLADQAHVPYGERSDEELHALLHANLADLRDLGADAVVMGCNTSCAVAGRLGWPAGSLPVYDLIRLGAAGLRGTAFGRVAVFATPATVRSAAYTRAIHGALPAADVVEIAAPALVPLVERGLGESDEAWLAVEALAAAAPAGLDALVYGCTHYPILDAHFARAFPGIARIDPAREQARAVAADRLRGGSARTTYVTSGDVALFERNVRRWTGDMHGSVLALDNVEKTEDDERGDGGEADAGDYLQQGVRA